MRVIALLATYNEERFIRACLKNLIGQGLDVYMIDNDSTDRTVAYAERYYGRGLIGIESFPREGTYRWRQLLARKEALAATLDTDWLMHVDADEIRLPYRSNVTLAEALETVDNQGYNAVNFMEYTFVPTIEDPNHDHPEFERSMRRYYPFLPVFPHRLNAWKRQDERVDLVTDGGHCVRFPGMVMCPRSFPMRHYLYLSVEHAVEKYVRRRYDPEEIAHGWHAGRHALRPERIKLLSKTSLRLYRSDDSLDPSQPQLSHPLFHSAPEPELQPP